MQRHDLADPDTCGEDLQHNLANVSRLARHYCSNCGDYHVVFAARRAIRPNMSIGVDRNQIAAIVEAAMRSRLSSDTATTDILIVGSSDTGVLATVAHGVARLGKAALSRTTFTVVDRCRTPLALCTDFSKRHGLKLATSPIEVIADQSPRSADLIVVHSLFRHLPASTHRDLLRKFRTWLSPGGLVIFSHRLEDQGEVERAPSEREETGNLVLRAVAEGRLSLGEPTEAFQARLARRAKQGRMHVSGYDDPQELLTLFAGAGLAVISSETIERAISPAGSRQALRRRMLTVLGRAEEDQPSSRHSQ